MLWRNRESSRTRLGKNRKQDGPGGCWSSDERSLHLTLSPLVRGLQAAENPVQSGSVGGAYWWEGPLLLTWRLRTGTWNQVPSLPRPSICWLHPKATSLWQNEVSSSNYPIRSLVRNIQSGGGGEWLLRALKTADTCHQEPWGNLRCLMAKPACPPPLKPTAPRHSGDIGPQEAFDPVKTFLNLNSFFH